jgi:hypothetical protein
MIACAHWLAAAGSGTKAMLSMLKTSTPKNRVPGGPQVWLLVTTTFEAGAENVMASVLPSRLAVTEAVPTDTLLASKPSACTMLVPPQSAPSDPVSNWKDWGSAGKLRVSGVCASPPVTTGNALTK